MTNQDEGGQKSYAELEAALASERDAHWQRSAEMAELKIQVQKLRAALEDARILRDNNEQRPDVKARAGERLDAALTEEGKTDG